MTAQNEIHGFTGKGFKKVPLGISGCSDHWFNIEPHHNQPTRAGHLVTISTIALVLTHQELGQPQEVAAAAIEGTGLRGMGRQRDPKRILGHRWEPTARP